MWAVRLGSFGPMKLWPIVTVGVTFSPKNVGMGPCGRSGSFGPMRLWPIVTVGVTIRQKKRRTAGGRGANGEARVAAPGSIRWRVGT